MHRVLLSSDFLPLQQSPVRNKIIREMNSEDLSFHVVYLTSFIGKSYFQIDLLKLSAASGSGVKFLIDPWNRKAGGGGVTCVLTEGKAFERVSSAGSWPLTHARRRGYLFIYLY